MKNAFHGKVNDKAISIENRVRAHLKGRIEGLQVRETGEGIVLRGYARTFYAKQLAQHAVMCETDMRIAANEIEVAG